MPHDRILNRRVNINGVKEMVSVLFAVSDGFKLFYETAEILKRSPLNSWRKPLSPPEILTE
jgi:hypothetical protein